MLHSSYSFPKYLQARSDISGARTTCVNAHIKYLKSLILVLFLSYKKKNSNSPNIYFLHPRVLTCMYVYVSRVLSTRLLHLGGISLVTGSEIADRKVKEEKDGKNTEILLFNS